MTTPEHHDRPERAGPKATATPVGRPAPVSPPYLAAATPWTWSEVDTLADTNIFSLRRRRCDSTTTAGKGGVFVYLDCPDWCNVIATTPGEPGERSVVMIEQFRYGTTEITLELPGGMLDPAEAPADAGVRELKEESGYTGGAGVVIGAVSSNPAIMNNHTHTVFVPDARPTAEQQLDGNEEIVVRLVPERELGALVAAGIIDHTLVVSALTHGWLSGKLGWPPVVTPPSRVSRP